MQPAEARTFYRVVESNPPTLRDFLSYEALDKPMTRRNPTQAELAAWEAVSTYLTEYAARKRAQENAARGLPIGDFIATLVIHEGGPIKIGRINLQSAHCDLTGEPAALLAAVTSTVRV